MKLDRKIIKELSEQRAKIIDDFCKLYISGRELTITQIKRLELVEQRTRVGATYYFRLKRGKLKG